MNKWIAALLVLAGIAVLTGCVRYGGSSWDQEGFNEYVGTYAPTVASTPEHYIQPMDADQQDFHNRMCAISEQLGIESPGACPGGMAGAQSGNGTTDPLEEGEAMKLPDGTIVINFGDSFTGYDPNTGEVVGAE